MLPGLKHTSVAFSDHIIASDQVASQQPGCRNAHPDQRHSEPHVGQRPALQQRVHHAQHSRPPAPEPRGRVQGPDGASRHALERRPAMPAQPRRSRCQLINRLLLYIDYCCALHLPQRLSIRPGRGPLHGKPFSFRGTAGITDRLSISARCKALEKRLTLLNQCWVYTPCTALQDRHGQISAVAVVLVVYHFANYYFTF